MWQIIKNEWKFLTSTRIMLGLSIAFLLVLLVTIMLGNYQIQKQKVSYQTAKDHVRSKWEGIKEMNPHGAAHYGTYVFKPTNLLSSLDEGVQSITGNILKVEGHVQNEITHSEASQMQSISKFGKLNGSLLLQYIIPLLLIFLSFHAVSNEVQSGRFKLLILQYNNPFKLILSKMLAIWLYGIALLAVTVLIYMLLNLKVLTGDDLLRTGFFFLAYGMYYFIICGLTIFFSSRWSNPTLAITSMLGIWIIWTMFLPSILLSTVEKWDPLPSRNEFKTAMKEDRSKGIDGHNPSDARSKELEEKVLLEYGVASIEELPVNFSGIRMQADEEYGNKVWDKHFNQLRTVFEAQKKNYQLGGIVNPFVSLQNASMGFTASDNLHHQDFLKQVELYRRKFIKMLNDEYAFGESQKEGGNGLADNEFFKSIPDFEFSPVKIEKALPHYLIDLTVLLFWGIFSYFLIWLASKKMRLI